MLCPYISSVRYARYSHTSRLCQSRPCPAKLAARPRTCASADAPPGKLAVRPRTRASAVARALYSHLITSTQTMLPILPCSPPQHCGCPRVLRRVTIHANTRKPPLWCLQPPKQQLTLCKHILSKFFPCKRTHASADASAGARCDQTTSG